ncbi:MAG: DUF3754 domain-containing protein [Isosphaeraceae bacterium]|nr:DUF3754 domain-containing protein [Isosphaeraceae bacterium]
MGLILSTSSVPPTETSTPIVPESAGSPLQDAEARERCIPIRPADLDRLLLAEPDLSPSDRTHLKQLGRVLGAVFHYEYLDWLRELKDLYAPLDPDSDCIDIEGASTHLTEEADEAFLKPFEAALIRANYRPLPREILEQAIRAPNELGLNYVPNLSLFEHLKVYARGNTRVRRVVRNLQTRFRKREVVYNGYQRLIVALKFKPDCKLDHYVRSDVLYLRLFKDVPHVDMEMHLPEQGTKVQMRWIDKAQIASPLVAFPAGLAMKLLGAALIGLTVPTLAVGSLVAAPVTASVNSFFGFQRAKQKHLHYMIRHLYYLTLANNTSVITRLIDSAEEEEYKEALLAYNFLWRHRDDPEPWDRTRLDAAIEEFLRRKLGLDLDFEVGDALNKLLRLGLVQADAQGRLLAAPIEQALAILDARWDDYFRYAGK